MSKPLPKWLTLSEAAALLPRRRRGRKVAASTPFRWAKYGLSGVFLEVWQVGGGLCTTREALEKFAEELSAKKGLRRAASHRPSDAGIDERLKAKGLIPEQGK
jgi:hypothetical protein